MVLRTHVRPGWAWLGSELEEGGGGVNPRLWSNKKATHERTGEKTACAFGAKYTVAFIFQWLFITRPDGFSPGRQYGWLVLVVICVSLAQLARLVCGSIFAGCR